MGTFLGRDPNSGQLISLIALTSAYLTLGVSTSPMIVGVAYLLFASTCFTVAMLLASSWADVIRVRELTVGVAAINTLGNIGAFVMPYGWGVSPEMRLGTFRLGLMALTAATVRLGALIFVLRSRVLKTQAWSLLLRDQLHISDSPQSRERVRAQSF